MAPRVRQSMIHTSGIERQPDLFRTNFHLTRGDRALPSKLDATTIIRNRAYYWIRY